MTSIKDQQKLLKDVGKGGAFGVSNKTDVVKNISKNLKKELAFDKTPKTNKFLKGFSPVTIARKIIAKQNKGKK
jgi:hypothetical protein